MLLIAVAFLIAVVVNGQQLPTAKNGTLRHTESTRAMFENLRKEFQAIRSAIAAIGVHNDEQVVANVTQPPMSTEWPVNGNVRT